MSDFESDLKEILVHELSKNGIEFGKAQDVTNNALKKVIARFKGNQIYIKRLTGLDQRNAEIYRRFNGRNQKELSIEFDLSYQQICQIVNQNHKKKQSDVFLAFS